jgi:hypothetical protein
LPKDAFEKPKISCDRIGKDRARPAVVLTFLRKLDRYLAVYSSVFGADDLKLDIIAGCFPADSAADRWYLSHKRTFTSVSNFRDALIAKFGGTPSTGRFCRTRLLSFRQRDSDYDSVSGYYTAFTELVDDIHALAHFLHGGDRAYYVDEAQQVIGFVHGLRQPVRDEVERIHIRNPDLTLVELLEEAELEEKHDKRKRKTKPVPQLNSIDSKTKRCYFCKGAHDPKDCKKIAAKKAAGTWVDKPKRS